MTTQKLFTPEEAQARLTSLSQAARDYIYSQPMYEALKAISLKHRLHIDQLAMLEAETAAVMLGFTEPADFVAMLQENLHLDAPAAEAVAQDINMMILQKVRESMQRVPPRSEVASTPTTSVLPRTIMPTPKQPAPYTPPTQVKTAAAPVSAAPRPPAIARPSVPPPATRPSVPPASMPHRPSAPQQKISTAPPMNLPGMSASASRPPAAAPASALSRVDEKLSGPSVSATKMVDLSLGSASKPPAPPPAASEPSTKKPYTKDPYREPVE